MILDFHPRLEDDIKCNVKVADYYAYNSLEANRRGGYIIRACLKFTELIETIDANYLKIFYSIKIKTPLKFTIDGNSEKSESDFIQIDQTIAMVVLLFLLHPCPTRRLIVEPLKYVLYRRCFNAG